jgi:hypothetical protein
VIRMILNLTFICQKTYPVRRPGPGIA